MKASEARRITVLSIEKKRIKDEKFLWDKVFAGIKASAETANNTLNYPKEEMTEELRKNLKKNGYKVNDCQAPEDSDDMHYTQISW